MGAFAFVLELLDVRPQIPGEAPLTVQTPSRGWRVFTKTRAATALRLSVGCTGRYPTHAVGASLRKNRGGHPVSGARYFGVAKAARKNMEV